MSSMTSLQSFIKTLGQCCVPDLNNSDDDLIKVFSLAVPIMTVAAMTASLCHDAFTHEATELEDQEPYDRPLCTFKRELKTFLDLLSKCFDP